MAIYLSHKPKDYYTRETESALFIDHINPKSYREGKVSIQVLLSLMHTPPYTAIHTYICTAIYSHTNQYFTCHKWSQICLKVGPKTAEYTTKITSHKCLNIDIKQSLFWSSHVCIYVHNALTCYSYSLPQTPKSIHHINLSERGFYRP